MKRIHGVPVELCETLNDLDELMEMGVTNATIDLVNALNANLVQQFECQMPAKR